MSQFRSVIATLATILVVAASRGDARAQVTGTIWTSHTTGTVLMQVCGNKWEFGFYESCGSYITGLIDGLSAGRVFCPGNGVGAMQLSTIAYQHLAASPEEWHKPASVIIGNKLASLYPCM